MLTVNRPGSVKMGTVGKAIPGVTLKIAGDGEILAKGPNIMKGYHNLPDQTAEAIDAEGWFHTGDIGEIDDEGFLKITDRKNRGGIWASTVGTTSAGCTKSRLRCRLSCGGRRVSNQDP